METGPSSSRPVPPTILKLGFKYFEEQFCYAPSRKMKKAKIELGNTILEVLESPMLPPEHERGPSLDTPMPQSVDDNFQTSYHIHSVQPNADLDYQRCLSCIVSGKSVDERTCLHHSPQTGSVFKRT